MNPFDVKKQNPFDTRLTSTKTVAPIFPPLETGMGGVTTQAIPDSTTPNFNPVLPATTWAYENIKPLKGIAERGASVIESIQQKSLDPLKKSLAKQKAEYFAQDPAEQAMNMVIGFMGGSGDISRKLTQNAKQAFLRQEVEAAMKAKAARTLEAPIKTTQTPSGASTLFEAKALSEPLQPSSLVPETKINKPETLKTDLVKPFSYDDSIQQTILNARDAQRAQEAFNAVPPTPLEYPTQTFEMRQAAVNMRLPEKVPNYKDVNVIKKNFRDIYRNTEEVFGKDFPEIERVLLNPLDNSKGAFIDMLQKTVDDLKSIVVKQLGIKPGTEAAQAVRMFGEGKASMQELIDYFGISKANQIVEADNFFRQRFDETINAVNKTEQQIYPNSPYKWTPKLKNYYPHGDTATSDFSRLQTILDNPIKIDPLLSGISETTQPKTKWQAFKQRRLGTDTTKDAIEAYVDYMKSAAYSIHIDPNIGRFRELADSLARTTQQSKNLNNYIYNLRMFADSLAGKTSDPDRLVSNIISRTGLEVLNWGNNRVKANTILFSNSASLAQILNIPQGVVASGPINSMKGLAKTFGQIFTENLPMKQSTFLKERYFKGFNQFDVGVLNNTKKFGMWMVTVLDELSTKFIWNSQYEKALASGIPDPIHFADVNTRKLVGGRGIGEKSLIQNSKIFQLVAPFQLEVTNQWWVQEDLAKQDVSLKRKIGDFMTLFVGWYLFNNLMEDKTGNRPLIDPIQLTIDGVNILKNEPSWKGAVKTGGRIFGEFLGNIPVGQTLATAYPEYGMTIAGVKLPTRREFFGREDPTRFGSGILLTKGMADPFYKLFPPFGGSQLKKTIEGVSLWNQGKKITSAGSTQYKVDQTLSNLFRAGLFGKSGLPETQAYYNKKNQPKVKSTSGGNPFDN